MQNPERKNAESTAFGNVLSNHHLWRYYFHDNYKPKIANEIVNTNEVGCLWYPYNCISFEEMRTILGAPKDEYYKEGDDLCENLYRLEIGAPLRFGHITYGNDPRVREIKLHMHTINKVIETCKYNISQYK